MGDMGGFDLSMMPEDYNFVQPGGAGMSYDWSNPSAATMPDFGGFQGGGDQQGPTDYASYGNPYPSAVQSDSPYSGGGPAGPGTTMPQQQQAPSVGQATGSSGANQAAKGGEDDWKKMLLKLGIGGGIGALGSIGSAAIGAMGNKGQPQQSTPLPQPPASAIPQAAPMVPLPGTQASPLISGMPQSVQQSTGLQTQDRMRRGGSTGGLQLY